MKIIYNKIIPFRGYVAIMLFGVIFARKEYEPLPYYVIIHEKIHAAQARDCGGYVWFYLLYAYWWIRRGYRNNPFEREAYFYQDCSWNYLDFREKYGWKKFIKIKKL